MWSLGSKQKRVFIGRLIDFTSVIKTMFELGRAHLYGICDLGYVELDAALKVTEELLLGGVGVVQLRAKQYAVEDLVELAHDLQLLCRQFKVPFVINDHLCLAQEIGADGLHLGQEDGSLQEARSQLPKGTLLGRSTHSLAQARQALAEGADYLGFGPLFLTDTKPGRSAIGLESVAQMQQEVGKYVPVFCIGGIKQANLAEVQKAGAQRVCIVSELLQAEQRTSLAKQILDQLESVL